jgi:hypothetical protein
VDDAGRKQWNGWRSRLNEGDPKTGALLRRALDEWQQDGVLTHDEHQRLTGTLKRVSMDWQRLSRYAFWTALACVIIAIGSLFPTAS